LILIDQYYEIISYSNAKGRIWELSPPSNGYTERLFTILRKSST
jgi:hypothetical protein